MSVFWGKNLKRSKLEPYFSMHMSAMTEESLHDKADIAAELALRDAEIAQLRSLVDKLAFDKLGVKCETT